MNRLGRTQVAAVAATAGTLLLLLATRLWLIGAYGNGTPFWDQWDAEAAYLFGPWLKGTLRLHDLVAAHNEHRILSTRLLALALLEVNGRWSAWLEMTVNAFLHVAALGLAVLLAWRAAGRGALPLLLVLALAIFLVPYGWENTLSGFQSQFYFVLLFALAALWPLVVLPSFQAGWWWGVALAWMAFFSLASGAVAFAAAAAILLLRGVLLHRRRDLLAVAVLAVMFLVAVSLVPSVEYHAALRAQDLSALLQGAATALAWPFAFPWLALLRNAPTALLAAYVVRHRLPAGDSRWFLVAMCTWTIAQEVSLAYGRAAEVLAPRYLDLHALSLFANAASLVALFTGQAGPARRVVAGASAVWMIVAVLALGSGLREGHLVSALQDKRAVSERQQANLRSYLGSGDRSTLRNLPPLGLPYPSADRLCVILASPEVRSILPSDLQTGEPGAPGRLDAMVRRLLGLAPHLGVLGVLLGLAGIALANSGSRYAAPNEH